MLLFNIDVNHSHVAGRINLNENRSFILQANCSQYRGAYTNSGGVVVARRLERETAAICQPTAATTAKSFEAAVSSSRSILRSR